MMTSRNQTKDSDREYARNQRWVKFPIQEVNESRVLFFSFFFCFCFFLFPHLDGELEEQPEKLHVARLAAGEDWCLLPIVAHVRIGSGRQQHGHHLARAADHGQVQR